MITKRFGNPGTAIIQHAKRRIHRIAGSTAGVGVDAITRIPGRVYILFKLCPVHGSLLWSVRGRFATRPVYSVLQISAFQAGLASADKKAFRSSATKCT